MLYFVTNIVERRQMLGSLDAVDREIIAILQQDGRTTNTEIARRLGVAEGTIRRRIDRLVSEGFIKIAAVCDPFKVGMGTVAMIHLDVELTYLEEAAARLVEMPCVRVVAYATGIHDIIVEAIFASNQDLLVFLKDKIPQIPGIRNAETSILLKLLKRSYEWGLPETEQCEQLQTTHNGIARGGESCQK
ncbi:MAG: Lrp/AsnC family transcriptional regulator [Candidatus Methanosuratincola sp.]|jgi:Lrp/AsnC family transcriptional regulator for asnA, asnC and gidA